MNRLKLLLFLVFCPWTAQLVKADLTPNAAALARHSREEVERECHRSHGAAVQARMAETQSGLSALEKKNRAKDRVQKCQTAAFFLGYFLNRWGGSLKDLNQLQACYHTGLLSEWGRYEDNARAYYERCRRFNIYRHSIAVYGGRPIALLVEEGLERLRPVSIRREPPPGTDYRPPRLTYSGFPGISGTAHGIDGSVENVRVDLNFGGLPINPPTTDIQELESLLESERNQMLDMFVIPQLPTRGDHGLRMEAQRGIDITVRPDVATRILQGHTLGGLASQHSP